MKIIFVIGLPASGKTTFVYNTKLNSDLFVDDPTDIRQVFEVCDKARNKNVNVYIADPKFCVCNILRSAIETLKDKYSDADLEFVYFDNNPQQCVVNAKNRMHSQPEKKVENFIWQLSELYRPNSVYEGKLIAVYS